MKIMSMRNDLGFRRGMLHLAGLMGLSTLLVAAPAAGPAAPKAMHALPDPGEAGVVVDAIAAVVNHQAITRSEVEDAAWFARFSASLNGRNDRSPLRADEYRQALQHLVDQSLLIQEQKKAGYGTVPEKVIQGQIDGLAKRVGGREKLPERLAEFHLPMATVQELIGRQLNVLHFLDEKLRPSIVIDEQQIETYYQRDFVPAARARKLQPAPLDQIREEIRRILLEQEMGRQQQQWLQQLRASAVIETRTVSLSPAG